MTAQSRYERYDPLIARLYINKTRRNEVRDFCEWIRTVHDALKSPFEDSKWRREF